MQVIAALVQQDKYQSQWSQSDQRFHVTLEIVAPQQTFHVQMNSKNTFLVFIC